MFERALVPTLLADRFALNGFALRSDGRIDLVQSD
jgi:hypothetical protein